MRSSLVPVSIPVLPNDERFLDYAAENVITRTRSGTGPDPTRSWSVERSRP